MASPQITLDATLADLYALDGGNPDELAIVIGNPGFDGPISSSLPENVKYAYQNPNYDKLDNEDIYARILLGAFSQYMGFVAGSMPLNLFDIDKTTYETWASYLWTSVPGHQVDAERVFGVLSPDQRPNLGFISAADKFRPTNSNGRPAKLVINVPLDCMSQHTGVVTADMHYQLLSKLELARSGIPSAPTELLVTSLTPKEVENDLLVENESARFINAVRDRPLPFVLKFPQSLAGHGVFVIRTEEERYGCLPVLEAEVPLMIRSMNAANEHLNYACLILQDMLPGSAVAHSLFVTKTGRPIFVACCEQLINDEGYWTGAVIDYKRQAELEEQYAPTARLVADYAHSKGYYGPMGCDIMTSNGGQYVIDLNIRLTGSYVLGFLKGHFSEQRGLHFASVLVPLALRGDRDAFEKRFAKEVEEGRIVIVGWCRGRGGPGGLFRYSVAAIVVGGEDQNALMGLIKRVEALQIKR